MTTGRQNPLGPLLLFRKFEWNMTHLFMFILSRQLSHYNIRAEYLQPRLYSLWSLNYLLSVLLQKLDVPTYDLGQQFSASAFQYAFLWMALNESISCLFVWSLNIRLSPLRRPYFKCCSLEKEMKKTLIVLTWFKLKEKNENELYKLFLYLLPNGYSTSPTTHPSYLFPSIQITLSTLKMEKQSILLQW